MYIYNLPYNVRSDLVASLSIADAWKELAGQCLNYDNLTLQKFVNAQYKPGTCPADALLTHWGQRNHTCDELFMHLYSLKLFQSMDIIKDHVAEKLLKFLKKSPQKTSSTATGAPRRHYRAGLDEPPPAPPPLPPSNLRLKQELILGENLDRPGNDPASSDARIAAKMTRNVPQKSDADADDSTRSDNCAGDMDIKRVDYRLQQQQQQQQQQRDQPAQNPTAPPPPTTTEPFKGMPSFYKSGIPIPDDGFNLPNYSYEDLKEACDGFSAAAALGKGGFGEVFKGKLRSGQHVAVKRILERNNHFQIGREAFKRCIDQVITELQALRCFPAENILPLVGIHFDMAFKTDPCLIFQLMPNGSVADRLRKRAASTPPLTWDQRGNIALGTARGLTHLHFHNIIHGDIKSGNILLDKHLEPKIGDFGLARGGPDNDATVKMVSMVKGTRVYLPNDYIKSGQLNVFVDTFCFGIFLLELVTGHSPAFIPRNEDYPSRPGDPVNPHLENIRELMLESKNLDPRLVDSTTPRTFMKWPELLFFLGKDCAHKFRQKRPAMKDVLNALERLVLDRASPKLLQELHDKRQQRQQIPIPAAGQINQSTTTSNNHDPNQVLIPTILAEQNSTTTRSDNTKLDSSSSLTSEAITESSSGETSSSVAVLDRPASSDGGAPGGEAADGKAADGGATTAGAAGGGAVKEPELPVINSSLKNLSEYIEMVAKGTDPRANQALYGIPDLSIFNRVPDKIAESLDRRLGRHVPIADEPDAELDLHVEVDEVEDERRRRTEVDQKMATNLASMMKTALELDRRLGRVPLEAGLLENNPLELRNSDQPRPEEEKKEITLEEIDRKLASLDLIASSDDD